MFFFLEGLQLQNEFFMKHSYLLTPKITFNVDNSLWFLHAVQDLGDSLCQTQLFVSDYGLN